MSVAGDEPNSRAPAERHVECYLIESPRSPNRDFNWRNLPVMRCHFREMVLVGVILTAYSHSD